MGGQVTVPVVDDGADVQERYAVRRTHLDGRRDRTGGAADTAIENDPFAGPYRVL